MRKFKTNQSFKIKRGIVYIVPYFDGFENAIGEKIEINDNIYTIKEVERNKCSGFFSGTEEEWKKRDVYLLV